MVTKLSVEKNEKELEFIVNMRGGMQMRSIFINAFLRHAAEPKVRGRYIDFRRKTMEMEENKLTRSDTAAVMDFAAALGEAVLIRGGELWRVEEVINSIFRTYGLQDGGIFMLPHTLIISARADGLEPVMRQKNVGEIVVDMEELSGLTTLIHRINKERPAPETLMEMLEQAEEGEHYPPILTICGMAVPSCWDAIKRPLSRNSYIPPWSR